MPTGTYDRSHCLNHDLSVTPEYGIWRQMIQRCYNRKHKSFSDYGARGITVCARWRRSPKFFLADMGRRPSPKFTLDRKENNGNYCPSNCRWATRAEQMRNQSDTRHYTFEGETHILTDWAKIKGIEVGTLYWRVVLRKPPLPLEQAFSQARYGNRF